MSAPPAFYVEDIVGLVNTSDTVGVVECTLGDVDNHNPSPQRDWDETIECHGDIPKAQFKGFMKTGIPPKDTALVVWQSSEKIELVPTARLKLHDRAFVVGDVVKRNAQDIMSGTVIAATSLCDVTPDSPQYDNQHTTEEVIHEVPVEELVPASEYIDMLIMYKDWIGLVEDVVNQVKVRLKNGSVVEVDDPDELEPEHARVENPDVGDVVTTKKGNLRRGRWVFGSYVPSVEPKGRIVDARTSSITVSWLCRRLGAPSVPVELGDAFTPPVELDSDALQSGEIKIYDKTRAPKNCPRRGFDLTVGHRVRFKDPQGAAIKYDGSTPRRDGQSNGAWRRIPRTATQGFDLNILTVSNTYSEVVVQWQDLSISTQPSISLIPDSNVEDDDEVWPGEIVMTHEKRAAPSEQWYFEPSKVGVVQGVKAADRIAQVRWFEDSEVKYSADTDLDDYSLQSLLGGARLDRLSDTVEEVSLYDIRTASGLNKRRGDYVVIHPSDEQEALSTTLEEPKGITWFGEVIDLSLDGQLVVRLGALDDVQDISVAPQRATVVYSSDMAEQMDAANEDDTWSDAEDEDDEELDDDLSDLLHGAHDPERPVEISYEYEGAEPMDVDDNAWATESDSETGSFHTVSEGVNAPLTDPKSTSSSGSLPKPQAGLATTTPPTPSAPSAPSATASAPFNFSTHPNAPASFLVLDDALPATHHFASTSSPDHPGQFLRRIQKEHKILRSSLPEGVFVRTYSSRLDLLRVLFIGPQDTPYELAPFLIDIQLPPTFPAEAPKVFFHSWTDGRGPINPNLYENGTICLSLLGTWASDEMGESWSTSSTILQVLVSILGLVLVKEPYFNEAGFAVRYGTEDAKVPSKLYSERAYFRSRGFIAHALVNLPPGFEQELKWLYLDWSEGAPRLLDAAIKTGNELVASSEGAGPLISAAGLEAFSKGAVIQLKRYLVDLDGLKNQTP